MSKQKRSKYTDRAETVDARCEYCYYYSNGLCSKENDNKAIAEPTVEYCSDFSENYVIENAAAQKRSV